MKHLLQPLALLMLLLGAPAQPLLATAYEAPLPVELGKSPDLCAFVPCTEVLPGADLFSQRKGHPSYVEAYRGETDGGGKILVGYVFLSTDIVDIPAYSGKPVVTLIGMNTAGIITGVKILRHSEPILLVGIPEEELTKFTKQYVGRFVGTKMEVGRSRAVDGHIGVDAISGATVTVVAENQVILRSGYEIARQVGILQPKPRPPAKYVAAVALRDWAELMDEGSVQRLRVGAREVGVEDTSRPYMDMHFGLLNPPAIGVNILGEENYRRLMVELKDGEQAIFVIAAGSGSFKGSGFVRGGIFDRIQVAQEIDTFTFRDRDYRNLYEVHSRGAPDFTESGIFIIHDPGFSAAYPWSLIFLANKVDRETGERSFASFSREYWLPGVHLEGGRPAYQRPEPEWVRLWREKFWELGGFVLMLALSVLVFLNRDRLVRASWRKDKSPLMAPRYLIWSVSVFLVGGYAMAQPSITHVLTWFHALLYQWRWELFLSDPYIFIFWWFIIITVVVWGRGLFCGWLCPYGALNEIVFKIASKTRLRRWQFVPPRRWHDRMKWLKYVIFAGLLGVSFYSMGLAERLAEVEPFKTTFLIGVWNRSWPFVVWWCLLLAAAVFVERPFCKYLCPLGAALAVPSTFRFIGLKRKSECETCAACAVGCSSLAIDRKGRIDQRECMLCLDCMVMYYDKHSCPPLSAERKARLKAGQPLTRINARGYFEPLTPAAAVPAPVPPTAPAPVPAPRITVGRWLLREFLFHAFPWDRNFLREIFVIRAVAVAAVVAVSVAWTLMATSRIGPAVVLAWWLGWSVYEVMSRMRYKPRVKEGPWWGDDYRPATLANMVAYVATKNVMIAAALFLLLKASGVLSFLQSLPALDWLYR